jgi:hypothetical protein
MQDKTIEIEFIVDGGKTNYKRQVTMDEDVYADLRLKDSAIKVDLGKKKRGRPPAKNKKKKVSSDDELSDQGAKKMSSTFVRPNAAMKEFNAQVAKEFRSANFDDGKLGEAGLDEHSEDLDDEDIDNKSDDDEFIDKLKEK